MKNMLLGIELAGFPNHLARSRVEQHVLLSQREKVRALPHLPGLHGIDRLLSRPLSRSQRVQVLARAQILRAGEKHASSLLGETRADAEIPLVIFAPEKGVAESRQAGIARCLYHGLALFVLGVL